MSEKTVTVKVSDLEKIYKELDWAYWTLKDKLKFGLPEENAIKNRERRCKGVLLTVRNDLTKIIKKASK